MVVERADHHSGDDLVSSVKQCIICMQLTVGPINEFLPHVETIAFRAVNVIVSRSDGRASG